MPSSSVKQHNFMAAVANNPAFAKKAGVPQSVGKDFTAADKGLKLKTGPARPDLQRINKPVTNQGKNELFKKGGDTMATKMNPGFMAMMAKKKAGASGMAAFEKSGKDKEKGMKEGSKADMAMDKNQMGMKKGGATKKMASGGSASARADGIASKGKTQGKMLKKGGKAC
jgi:hypothetical protein